MGDSRLASQLTSVIPEVRAFTRRELVFVALGTMDVCVITPLYVAFLTPLVDVKPWSTFVVLLVAILFIHCLARLTLSIAIDLRLRSALIVLCMLLNGLLTVHYVLYAQKHVWGAGWLRESYRSVRQSIFAPDILVFLLTVFLWWRGLMLAQRRLDSRSVAFRFRLGVVLLAISTGIAGSMITWSLHHVVFLFFFTSLLGIALARAEEIGQQYGGRQTPFNFGWLTTIAITSATVLAFAAGLTSLLTGKTLGRALVPVLRMLQVLVFILIYAFAWAAQFVLEPILNLLRQYEIGRALADIFDEITPPQYTREENGPVEPSLTPEQLETIRVSVAVFGAMILLVLVAVSLHRLRAKSGGPMDEERESVWDGVHLQRGLDRLFRSGQKRLSEVADALVHSPVGGLLATLTIRRIYAHMASLAASRGYPRAIDDTPYDYLPTLRNAFPNGREEVRQITEAYVAVHYGELPERQEDVVAVRSAWRHLRRQSSSHQGQHPEDT